MKMRLSEEGLAAVKMLLSQKQRLIYAFLFVLIAATAELIPFWILYQAVNLLFFASDATSQSLFMLAGAMLIAIIVKYACYSLAYFFSHHAAYSILVDTRRYIVNRLAWAPLPWLQQQSSGQLKQALMQDVERIESFVAHHLIEGLAALLGPLIITVFLCWIDWRLALAALICAPLALLTSAWAMRGMSRQYDCYIKQLADLDSASVEYVRNIAVMKVFRLDASRFEIMRRRLAQYYVLIEKMTKNVIGGWSLFTCLLNTSVLFVLPVGIWLYSRGDILLSDIVLAIMLGAGVLRPLLKISHLNADLREVMAGIRRLIPLMSVESTQSSQTKQVPQDLTLTLNNVCFAYQEHNVLNDISFTLKSASLTILMGPSGSGKSALAQLIAGLLQPQSGQVFIGDIPLTSFSETQRTSLIGLATQEPFLFQGTIMDNLRLGNQQASDDEIYTAVKVAQAESLINGLPGGYQTKISEQGVSLSGGERQRIAIARVLVMATPVLILDEATAFADSLTQKAFYRDLRRYYPQKTLLVIAHRSYGIEQADQILIMQKGYLTDVGTHETLLTKNAFYQQMWRQQTESENWSIVRPGEAE